MANSGHPVIDHLLREQEALLQAIPEWKADPKRAQAEMAEIRAGLVKHYGVDPSMVETFPHHHGVLIARDALRARSLHAQVEQMKAEKIQRKRVEETEKGAAAEQQRQTDLKARLGDVRRSPGGKATPLDIMADYLDGETRGKP